MRGRFIGIDAGGTMTKAALFDEAGTELACARRPNAMLFPAPGHTERDPDRMWDAACSAIRAVLDESGTDPAAVSAVAVTGYGSGLYLVDRDLNPVRPGIVSTDSRAAALVAAWEADGTASACAPLVQQRFWAGQAAPLLAWLAREEPEVIPRTHAVLWCKDFLRARLCGDISTDPTDAGIAGLIDVTTGRYAADLFASIGMGAWEDRLPPIGPSSEVCGTVSPAAARLTGLRPGTPVVRGVVDVAAASLASGMVDPSTLAVVAGTFSINQTLHATPRASTWPFLQCAYPVGGSFLATEGAPTSAGNLEWFCRVMLDAEAERAAAQGRTIYEVCEHLVGDALSRRSDILFFPFLFGGPRNAPAGLVGLTASGSLSDVVGAIYEGIAFAHRLDIDRLLSGPDAAHPVRVRLAGGGARSMAWPQLFSDVLHLPVEVMSCGELGAQGSALCAAAAVGAYPDLGEAVRTMPRVSRSYAPDPDRMNYYDRKYARFRRAIDCLGEAWTTEPAPSAPLQSRAAAELAHA